MANPFTTIYITHDSNAVIGTYAGLKQDTSNPVREAQALSHFFRNVAAGAQNVKIEVIADSAATFATATLTAASIGDTDTCVIGGVTLTAKTSPSGQSQYLRGVSNTADGAALAACINAHTSLAGMVTAASVAGVVTISSARRGTMGNGISLVGTATRLAASTANLTGGTGLAVATVQYSLGV